MNETLRWTVIGWQFKMLFYGLLRLFGVLSISLPVTAAVLCSHLQSPVRSFEVFGQRIRAVSYYSKSLNPKDFLKDYSKEDIFIGFGAGHVYLLNREVTYNAYPRFYRSNDSKVESVNRLIPRVVLRIKSPPKYITDTLKEKMVIGVKEKEWSCSAGTCRLLKDIGIDAPTWKSLLPTTTLKYFVTNNLKSLQGEELRTEWMIVGKSNFDKVTRDLNTVQLAEAMMWGVSGIVLTTGALVPIILSQ